MNSFACEIYNMLDWDGGEMLLGVLKQCRSHLCAERQSHVSL